MPSNAQFDSTATLSKNTESQSALSLEHDYSATPSIPDCGTWPDEIQRILNGLTAKLITENHRSGDLVYKFEEKYILKISENKEQLMREKAVNDFLLGKLPVPRSIAFADESDEAYYLRSCISGTP
ncbi:MAG: hypothetical protein HUJ69_07495, partial [Lachnospiraceae bacterium]|nr:hypothetical protein [Lachnospiraceae bacterium]